MGYGVGNFLILEIILLFEMCNNELFFNTFRYL